MAPRDLQGAAWAAWAVGCCGRHRGGGAELVAGSCGGWGCTTCVSVRGGYERGGDLPVVAGLAVS